MSKIARITIISLLSVIILALSFTAGCVITNRLQGQGLSTIEQAWNIIFTDYVDETKLDPAKLSQAAVSGMVEALDDPYTAYLDPETYELGVSSLEGSFEGIGAGVALQEGQITITAPLPDSPAAMAGIRPGDAVLSIDGKSTEGMTLTEAVLRVRGPKGTTVKLSIRHEGETQPVEYEITRAEINTASVRFEMRGDIALINITQFVERTDTDLTPVLAGLPEKGATGIILDLRGNPGGFLDTVVAVASHFIKSGVVVDVVDNQGRHSTSEVIGGEVSTDLPVVVLVDGDSASGSEVLSGALQDYGRATVAGTTTFGKGSVNILRPLNDGSGIYITTARWLTPQGRPIEGKGITPDIELIQTGEDAINWAIDYLKSRQPANPTVDGLIAPALAM